MKVTATRATVLVGREVPDPSCDPATGQTLIVWAIEYVPITVAALPLRKKYRS